MSSAKESWAVRLLKVLARAIWRHPQWFFYPQFVLFGVCVWYTWNFLEFDTSRNDLVGSDKSYHQLFLKFKKEFPTQDDLVVVVESEDPEKNRQFVERLGRRLEAETNLFTDVFYKGDLKMMGPKALLFVPEDDLRQLRQTLHEYRPFIDQFTQATNFVSLFSLINRQFLNARREANAENTAMARAIPALERIIVQATQTLQRPGTPPSPGVTALFGAGEEAEQETYITFASGRIYLVTTHAKSEEQNGEAVERLRHLAQETRREVPGLNVGITGEPVLEVDEMAQSKYDSTWASVISLVVCAFIFIYGYRETGRPLKATLCLIIGLGYTMGFTTLFVGHLNILTITFVPILIGLAIDFGVHLITRFEEELRHGRTVQVSLEKALVNTGLGIFTGALTTAGAFLAMGATDFKGIQEMGKICGFGMLLCLVPMMTLLPVLLMKGRQNIIDRRAHVVDRRERIEKLWLDRPKRMVGLALALCGFAALYVHKVHFDYNLLHMQSKGLPAVVFEEKLINSASNSVLFAAVIATNLDQARSLQAALEKLPSVSVVRSMSQYLAEPQESKLEIVRALKEDLKTISFRPYDPGPIDLPELSRTLWAEEGYLGLGANEVSDDPELKKQLLSLRVAIGEFRKQMLRKDPVVPERLRRFQQALFGDLHDTFASLKNQDASGRLRIEDLPPPLRNRFVGRDGSYLLQVFPKQDVWQRSHQEEFVRELRRVEKNVTGTPVQLYEYTTLLKDSYQQAAWYALIAIALLVLVHFRSPVCVALALLPVGIGSLWMLGVMGFYDIPFNPANIMTLPLVIGIGVTNGIHILNRFAEERSPGILAKSTGKAVLVSGLTTIAGFGSLLVAKHQGISSLGLLMSGGVLTCMIAALAFLPALLTILTKMGWSIKKPSSDV
jgi:hopanoid biosynthesis associated RND transporter like protein HpnN